MSSLKPEIRQQLLLSNYPHRKRNTESGFTLIELLVVVIIIGILAAIAAPGWLGFMKQRRVNAAKDFIQQKVQEAQSKAKKEKLDYSVSFRLEPTTKLPQVAVHPATILYDAAGQLKTGGAPANAIAAYWSQGDLGRQVGVKSGEVLVLTNLKKGSNLLENTKLEEIKTANSEIRGITFDEAGVLKGEPQFDPSNRNPLKSTFSIVVAQPKGSQNVPTPGSKRCVMLRTLLGSMDSGRREYSTNDLEGCATDR